MVKLLTALLALVLPCAAFASGNQPPDVPAYVTITPTYASGTTLNVIGDGTAYGGTAPGDASQPAAIATADREDYIVTGTFGNSVGEFCLSDPVICPERKWRSHANATHVLYDDPIRNYGQPATSHCHTFFGNGSANSYSTYARARRQSDQASRSGGAGLNGNLYWYPCITLDNPFSDGKNYAIKPDFVVIYYAGELDDANLHKPPRGLRWVGGFNMDTGDAGQFLEDAVATANAQPGTAGRYSVDNAGNYASTHDIVCDGATSKWFKNADNSDPFAGNCTDGETMFIRFIGPNCWDGTNLWSPDGYRHVIPQIFDSHAAKFVCPNGWFILPHLALEILLTQHGFADYGRWKLSSDAAGTTAAGRTVKPGESFHTDWVMAFDQTTWDAIMDNCIGINGNTPHQCASGIFSSTERVISSDSNPLTGRSPQVDTTTTYGTASAGLMWQLPASGSGGGSAVINMHGD